jgi:hypothetical protein
MRTLNRFLPLLVLTTLFLSCKKDVKIEPPVVVPDKSPVVVFTVNAFANNRSVKASEWYSNSLNDSFTVSKLNYYISNIKLKSADGSVFAEPDSYHLNKHLQGINSFTLNNVPEGSYTSVEFIIGVDSAHNVSGSKTGALDETQGMFWDWNTGYVFFKLEGICKTIANPQQKDYSIHVGGFSGANNCLQKCTFDLSANMLSPKKNRQSRVTFHLHADEIFINPSVIGFDAYGAVSGGKQAKTVSANYRDMFEVYSVEN